MIEYVSLQILVPKEIEAEVREFFERAKTGQVELHVVHGKILGADCHSQKRVKSRG